jgi:hypothetical protein
MLKGERVAVFAEAAAVSSMPKRIGILIRRDEYEQFQKLALNDQRFACSYEEWQHRYADPETSKRVWVSVDEFSAYCLVIRQPPSFLALEALAVSKVREENQLLTQASAGTIAENGRNLAADARDPTPAVRHEAQGDASQAGEEKSDRKPRFTLLPQEEFEKLSDRQKIAYLARAIAAITDLSVEQSS